MGKLTQEQLNKFKQEIYEPYNTAWKIIQTLKQIDIDKQEEWDKYLQACEEFKANYPSELGGSIYRVLLDAGSEVGRIGRQK